VIKQRRTATMAAMAPRPLATPPPRSPWLSSHRCSSPASPAILARASAPRAPPLRFPSGLEPPRPLLSYTHESHHRRQQKWQTGAWGTDGEAETVARQGGGSGGAALA
jgi:hypothetical protein